MNYTVSDFYKTFENGMKIVAGSGGMSRIITAAGILDYEMETVLKDKYLHTNFHEGQLVVSTFLYAKENPFLIGDAVKYLAGKGISGLVIKNVFKLPIHDSVLRYADSKNFPIFIIDSQDIYVENIIYEVSHHCELLADSRFSQQILAQLLNADLTESEMISTVKRLIPSCSNQFFTMYFRLDDFLTNAAFDGIMQRFLQSDLNLPGTSLILQENSIFFVYARENIAKLYKEEFFRHIADTLLAEGHCLCCGISRYHLRLGEFQQSLKECIYAAFSNSSHAPLLLTEYGRLGIRQILYPFAKEPEMESYADEILSSVEDYDIENNSALLETLRCYLDNDCDLPAAAVALGQHKNTLRYRLDKIYELTGLDYKRFSHLEQLSAALKIRQAPTL